MIKNIPINPNLPLKRCWDMVNRIDTFEKANIAEEWLTKNEVITIDEYDDLMRAVAYKVRELYHIKDGRYCAV